LTILLYDSNLIVIEGRMKAGLVVDLLPDLPFSSSFYTQNKIYQ
jgi:hypothetical protein